jgi:DNA-binding MarR family transcriptional regulator
VTGTGTDESCSSGAGPAVPGPEPEQASEERELIDAFLSASRALVAVAARSLAACQTEITLPQYRALVVLSGRGPQRVADLAEALDVLPSTATRMCDRLAAKRLLRRHRSPQDRRSVKVAVTGDGRSLVDRVSQARREELQRVLAQLPPTGRSALVEALRAFSSAAGEVPEQDWALGWGQ